MVELQPVMEHLQDTDLPPSEAHAATIEILAFISFNAKGCPQTTLGLSMSFQMTLLCQHTLCSLSHMTPTKIQRAHGPAATRRMCMSAGAIAALERVADKALQVTTVLSSDSTRTPTRQSNPKADPEDPYR